MIDGKPVVGTLKLMQWSNYAPFRCPIKKAVVPNYLFGVRRTDTLTPKLQKDAARADLSPLPFSVQDASVRNIELAQVILALEEVHQTNAHLKWYRQKRGEDLFRGKKEALIDMFAECERVMSYSLEQVGKCRIGSYFKRIHPLC